jgi:exonuclease III
MFKTKKLRLIQVYIPTTQNKHTRSQVENKLIELINNSNKDQLPTIIMGDLNTHKNQKSKLLTTTISTFTISYTTTNHLQHGIKITQEVE